MEETSSNLGLSPVPLALSRRSLWMGSLDPSMDEELITAAFQRMGEQVHRVKYIRDKITGLRNSGYCFLEFKDQEAAEAALRRVNGKQVPNFPHCKFTLAPARTGAEKEAFLTRRAEFSLYVGNLTEEVTEADLLNFFSSRYSSVKEARLCKTPDGVTKGFGFVRFYNEQEHGEALRRMDGVRGLGSRTIFVKLATPKPSNFRGRYGETADRQEDHQDTYGYYSHHYQSNQYPQNQANPYYPTDAWGGHQSYQQPNYQAHYPQQYDYSNQTQETLPSTQQSTQDNQEKDEDEELADQEVRLNIDKMNEEFISNNEELYSSLEKSRWHFVDSVTTTIDEISMT